MPERRRRRFLTAGLCVTVLGLITACGAELEVSAAGPESPSVIEPGSGDEGATTQDSGTTATEPDTVTTEPGTTTTEPGTVTTEPGTVTTEPDTSSTDKPVGDFVITAPPAVVVDSAFNVEIVVKAGGGVIIETESANCGLVDSEPDFAVVSASEVGTCEFTASQRKTDDFDPADDKMLTVEVTKGQGRFDVVVESEVYFYADSFPVGVNPATLIGGEVTFASEDGNCVAVYGGFKPSAGKSCSIRATQDETAKYDPAPDEIVTVTFSFPVVD